MTPGEVIGSESRGSLSFGVLSNAEVKRSEEKVKFRDYVQSDVANRRLERHFAPVCSQLQASPAGLQVQPKAGGGCRSSPTVAGFEAAPRWPSSLSKESARRGARSFPPRPGAAGARWWHSSSGAVCVPVGGLREVSAAAPRAPVRDFQAVTGHGAGVSGSGAGVGLGGEKRAETGTKVETAELVRKTAKAFFCRGIGVG